MDQHDLETREDLRNYYPRLDEALTAALARQGVTEPAFYWMQGMVRPSYMPNEELFEIAYVNSDNEDVSFLFEGTMHIEGNILTSTESLDED